VAESVAEVLLERITGDLAARGIDVRTLSVVSVTTRVWPDGSLGCPDPGMSYPQQLVEGSRIVVEAGGRRYDYRASTSGTLRLCGHRAAKAGPIVVDVP
jgi:hypothetical protein